MSSEGDVQETGGKGKETDQPSIQLSMHPIMEMRPCAPLENYVDVMPHPFGIAPSSLPAVPASFIPSSLTLTTRCDVRGRKRLLKLLFSFFLPLLVVLC